MKKALSIFLTVFFLLGTVWTLYNQTQAFDYLNLDDHDYTFRCAFVKDGLSAANVGKAFTTLNHAAIWMPATYISYMCDISASPKLDPRRRPTQADLDRSSPKRQHHLTNTALHSINAVLLFFFLFFLRKQFQISNFRFHSSEPTIQSNAQAPTADPSKNEILNLKSEIGFDKFDLLFPLVAALFWALHPQRAEAVAWIAGRKEILCGTFTLAGLLCWLRATLPGRLGALLCCALACMSKPTAMCFPFLALALDLLLGRVPTLLGRSPQQLFAFVRPYLPTLVLAVLTGALAVFSQTHPEGMAELDLFTASFPWRVLNALVAVGLALAQLVVPTSLHLDYRATPEHFPLQGTLGLAVFLAATFALAVWLFHDAKRRKGGQSRARWGQSLLACLAAHRTTCALLVFFFAALVPTLGIFGSFGEHARADRFLYLPMIAFSMLFVLWRPRRPALVAGLGLAVCGLVCGLSYPLVASYQDNFTAFSRTLACDGDNGRALRHVAHEEFFKRKHLDKGVDLYRRSLAVRPRDDTTAWLAYALMKREYSQDYAEIRKLCTKFAENHALDRGGMALEALGMTALRERRWTEAIACLTDSIKAPGRSYPAEDAFLNLAIAYTNNKQQAEAVEILERLVRSRYPDIAQEAQKFYGILKANPKAILFP